MTPYESQEYPKMTPENQALEDRIKAGDFEGLTFQQLGYYPVGWEYRHNGLQRIPNFDQAAEDARRIAEYEASRPKPADSPTYNALFPNGLGRFNEEVHTIARCLCAQADATRELTAEYRAARLQNLEADREMTEQEERRISSTEHQLQELRAQIQVLIYGREQGPALGIASFTAPLCEPGHNHTPEWLCNSTCPAHPDFSAAQAKARADYNEEAEA
jgi:hypothetical protein